MSENTKLEVETGLCNLDERIGNEYDLKSETNLSEEKLTHDRKANIDNQKITNCNLMAANRNSYDLSLYAHGNDQPKVLDPYENVQYIVPEDNGNTHHLAARESYNKDKVSAYYEHDGDLVLDDMNDKNAEEHEDHGVVSGESGDDDHETVAENHDSENLFFPTDEKDMAFSLKKLIPCINRKKHKKGKAHFQISTIDNEKQTSSENIQTGNVHWENPCGRLLVHNKDVANRCIDPDQYDFSHPYRGHAVLIVNREFRLFSTRNGADVDVRKTWTVLGKLGFNIKHFINLDKESTLRVLQDAKSANHSKMDSFAFIISSHGGEIENPNNGKKEHAIYCSDDQYIFTNNILKMFNDENCPSLKGKPKLFFIQACRGTKTDPGSEIMVEGRYQINSEAHISSHPDGKNLASVSHERVKKAETEAFHCHVQRADKMADKESEENPIVHCHNDCLVMYAIPSGYYAYRNTTDGSWMLHYLWEEVQNYNFRKPCSFLKVLIAVNRKMANRETNVSNNTETSSKKAISVIIHQLDKDIVFQEKRKQ